jgi:hypothetical protein
MTGGDQHPDMASDEAQATIGRVADALDRGAPAEGVEGFETLPDEVQQILKRLSVGEGLLIARTLRVLADNGFFVVLPQGRIAGFV